MDAFQLRDQIWENNNRHPENGLDWLTDTQIKKVKYLLLQFSHALILDGLHEFKEIYYHMEPILNSDQHQFWLVVKTVSLKARTKIAEQDGTAYMLIGPKGGILTAWTSYDDNLPESVLIRRIRRGEKVLQ